MLCHRCGSHVPDKSESCATCGLKITRLPAGAGTRRRGANIETPYKPGDVFAKRYAIREVIGAGPVGHVFRVLDQEMDVEVALKIINPRMVQMPEERTQFSLALRTGKKLTHPYHVRVYEECEERNRPFFTMPLLEGMPLRQMMEQRAAQGQRFTPKEVEPLLTQLAEALDSAHKYGPHSDLKPENIIVLPDMLKVTDYGLALGMPRPPFVQAQKFSRVACYVAPEYVDGGELDTRMDLYSLGVIVGEMLTGKTPQEGEVPELLAYDPELPPGLEALYRRATNAHPLARPKTAGEFLAEFTAALSRPRSPSAKSAVGAQASVSSRPLPKPVPYSLTAELATASPLRSDMLPPPVPTSELPTLAAPTIEVPLAGGSLPQEAPTETLLEVPVWSAPTLEVPVPASIEQGAASKVKPDAPLPETTQPLEPAALSAILAKSKPAASSPVSKPRPEPRSALPTSPVKAAPRPALVLPGSRTRHRSSSVKWVLLVLAGLGLGAMAGYGLLKTHHGSRTPETPSSTRGVKR